LFSGFWLQAVAVADEVKAQALAVRAAAAVLAVLLWAAVTFSHSRQKLLA
jgi:hypothetical protein